MEKVRALIAHYHMFVGSKNRQFPVRLIKHLRIGWKLGLWAVPECVGEISPVSVTASIVQVDRFRVCLSRWRKQNLPSKAVRGKIAL